MLLRDEHLGLAAVGGTGAVPVVVDYHNATPWPHVLSRRLEVGLPPLDVMNHIVKEDHIEVASGQLGIRELA